VRGCRLVGLASAAERLGLEPLFHRRGEHFLEFDHTPGGDEAGSDTVRAGAAAPVLGQPTHVAGHGGLSSGTSGLARSGGDASIDSASRMAKGVQGAGHRNGRQG